jgi:hypothetical protein
MDLKGINLCFATKLYFEVENTLKSGDYRAI